MFQHVTEANCAKSVLCGVDVATGVLKSGLDDESRWIASLGGTCVIGASIAALGLYVWDSAVLLSLV